MPVSQIVKHRITAQKIGESRKVRVEHTPVCDRKLFGKGPLFYAREPKLKG